LDKEQKSLNFVAPKIVIKLMEENIFPNVTPEQLNQFSKGCMLEFLEIEFTEVGTNYLIAKMPVNAKTKQPFGLLHGGASVVLAESIGSTASGLVVTKQNMPKKCVGLEINANHLRSETQGFVYGKCTPIHIGRTTHVWDIQITNEQGKLICVSRLTMAILEI
jgi:1,4-dihydroxy-2-naphthoyl-CoA hydrolase